MIISFCARAEPNLSAEMHDLNSGYASQFNRRYRRSGSLFQGRFKALLVENQSHAWELSRYVHLNPVRAKMVPLPEQYRWSRCSAYRFAWDAADAPAWLDWETVLREHSKEVRGRATRLPAIRRGRDWSPTALACEVSG